MKNSTLAVIGVVVLVAVGGGYYWWSQSRAPSASTGNQSAVGIANPASLNCTRTLGGELDIVNEANGQVGYCHLPDGRVCEEWALYRTATCVPMAATSTATTSVAS